MKKYFFILILIGIAFLGLAIRLVDYDKTPPFAETQDEFFYPWAGMTWILKGVPTAWSWFPQYKNLQVVTFWRANYPLVSPWVEKPPLYSLLSGVLQIASGARELTDVRLSTSRLLPVGLSFFTILLVGLIAKNIFSEKIGLLSALLYATVPTIVLSSHLSLTENLLTPLALAALYCYLLGQHSKKLLHFFLAGASLAAVVLTKNIGIGFAVVLLFAYLVQKQWKALFVVGILVVLGALTHPAIGYFYDWHLYKNVMGEYQRAFADSGLPEFISTIFEFPTVARKDHVLLDGAMLFGYILFFAAPWWFFGKAGKEGLSTSKHGLVGLVSTSLPASINFESDAWKKLLLIFYPLGYLGLLTYLASGAGFSFYGWHLYPLFPFLTILVAVATYEIWTSGVILTVIVAFLVIGSSAIRFLFLFLPKNYAHEWQKVFLVSLLILLSAEFINNRTYRQLIYITGFIAFIGIQIFTSTHLSLITPSVPQPLTP